MKRKAFFVFVLTFLIFFPFISHSNAQTYKVERVVDGDTVLPTNGEYVRLISVDTPETKHPEKPVEYFGKEAYLLAPGYLAESIKVLDRVMSQNPPTRG